MENAETSARRGEVGEGLGPGFENDAALTLGINNSDNLQLAAGGLVVGAVANVKSAVSLIAFETGNRRRRRLPARTAHNEGDRAQGLMPFEADIAQFAGLQIEGKRTKGKAADWGWRFVGPVEDYVRAYRSCRHSAFLPPYGRDV